jgi:hypothetical protein
LERDAEALRTEGKKIEFVGVQDKFGTSARTYESCLRIMASRRKTLRAP